MLKVPSIIQRVLSWRVFAALTILLLTYIALRPSYHRAWRAVAVGAAFALLWHFLRRAFAARAESNAEAAERRKRGSALLIERTVEDAEAELAEANRAQRQLQQTYREVARLHREQKGQIAVLQASERLFDISVTAPAEDSDAGNTRLLALVMDFMEAGGGVLWLRVPNSDSLTAQVTEGRVLPAANFEIISDIMNLSHGDLKAQCESGLLAAAPAVPANLREPVWSSELEETQANRMHAPQPVLISILRTEGAEEILGAIGLCDPRGATRFSPADEDRLRAVSAPLVKSLQNFAQRQSAQRRLREVSLLYDLSRLIESAADMEQVYKAVAGHIQKALHCENCTLSLLDRKRHTLEAKATRGRAINLLEHIAFEKGQGVSGWVAARGRQIVIHDLDREPNLLNVESLPARVRSFVATPMRVHNTVVGVIHVSHSEANAFSPDDVQLLTILAAQAAVTIERTEEFHTLETLAITDGLTRAYNHRYFQMRLEDELRRCKRYHLPLSLLILDADHFKDINDQYGHASGDAVLRDMGTLLRESVRDTEIVGRLGGEEFALLLPQTELEQARIAAERLRVRVESHDFRSMDGQPIRVTISLGLAAYPLHGADRSGLLEQADKALYAAKRDGRNRLSVAETLTLATYGVVADVSRSGAATASVGV